jgi:FKBP-type peptidyl-prolyl cis-trans isomerase (trigger factor)
VDVTLPESVSADYGGQEVQVLVEINYIAGTPVVPELTDEFAASLDGWDCSTAEEFKAAYRSYLAQKKADYYDTQYRDALWAQVMSSAVLTDDGEAYVDSFRRKQLDDCRAYAESSGITLDDLAVKSGYNDGEALLSAVGAGAADEAKTLLVTNYIADAEGIAYTDEDYYGAVDDYAQSEGFEKTADLIDAYGLDDVKETVGSSLLYNLVRDFVAENAA